MFECLEEAQQQRIAVKRVSNKQVQCGNFLWSHTGLWNNHKCLFWDEVKRVKKDLLTQRILLHRKS